MYNMAKGVLISAVYSFVMGATVFSFTIYTLISEEQLQTTSDDNPVGKNVSSHHLQHVFGLNLDKTSIDLIVSFVLLISSLTMIFSILLIIGMKKNSSSLVVAYFSFGSLLCLLLLVCTVLELLQRFWYTAGITAIIALIMTKRVATVYNVYENMVEVSESKLLLEESESVQEPINTIIDID